MSDRFSVHAVVRTVGEDGFVDVELGPMSRCSGCAGTCMWTRADVSRAARLACRHSVQPGDSVRVHLPANHLVRGALLLYGLPLASMLAGGALGAFMGQSDLGCLAGALAGVASMLAVTPSLRRRIERLTVDRVRVEPLL